MKTYNLPKIMKIVWVVSALFFCVGAFFVLKQNDIAYQTIAVSVKDVTDLPKTLEDMYASILENETIYTASGVKDNTAITFLYNNKSWKYVSKHINTPTFDSEYNANKYARNGTKTEKMNMINKAISIGIPKQKIFEFMYKGLHECVQKMTKSINCEPKDAVLTIQSNTATPFKIRNEVIGVKVDEYMLFELVYNQYFARQHLIVKVPVKYTYPKVTAKKLKNDTTFRGGFSTSIASSGKDRKHNVKKSLQTISGLKISAGEKVSFNNIVGRRNVENGYRVAKIIVDGEFVDGTGGGVCQTSTTLYNALLLSGVNILSVHKHSQRVSYVPVGLDAMVNYGSSDLVFENNTAGDLYIIGKYTNTKITINIYGQPLEKGVVYKTISETEQILPAGEMQVLVDKNKQYIDKIKYDDEYIVLKARKDGIVAKSYLCKYKDNVLVNKKFLRKETYKPENGTKIIGSIPASERSVQFFIDEPKILV